MKIEAVVICNNYSDFLEHTMPENLQHLDRLVVVTHPDDKKTQQLCAYYGVDCIDTTVFHDDGDKFNKGRAINLGLSHLRHEDWLLHMDADILLPHRFRQRLKEAKLDPKNIYGADRQNVVSYEHFHEHKHKMTPQHKWRYLVEPMKEFPLGSRLLHMEHGYCPIGYFQLWHSSERRKYHIVAGSAEHSDVLFAVQWSRENRILLPEFFVFHLESEGSKMGINWDGRKSKPFEGKCEKCSRKRKDCKCHRCYDR
jgi:glycosyltransferase involved in cell wall biosynthesis